MQPVSPPASSSFPPPRPPSGMSAGGLDADSDDFPPGDLAPLDWAALRWAVRLADGPGPGDQAAFEAWLAADAGHADAWQRMSADLAQVTEACDALPEADRSHLRTQVILERAATGSPREGRPETGPKAGSRSASHRQSFLKPALVSAVVAAGAWLGWQAWLSQPVFAEQFATRRGELLEARLPDGSQLSLDTATVTDVTLYRHRREVHLPEGQALFKVQGDAARPFDVVAGNARVTVVGTRFSVRHTPSLGSQAVEVAVLEGRVRVRATEEGGEGREAAVVELGPGDRLRVDGDGRPGEIDQLPTSAMASWREQRLSFDDVPLATVLAELERYQLTGLKIGDAAVGALAVTASVDLRNIAAFTRSLPLVLPVRLVRQADGSRLLLPRT